MMEVFDLDFHILTPGGGDEYIMRVEGGVLTIVPPKVAPQMKESAETEGLEMLPL
jgi:hypothetical protein